MATPIKGILFDIDGTLIDSNDAHAQSWVDAYEEAGHAVAFEKIRPLIGKGGDKLMPETSGIDPESAEGKKITQRRGDIFKRLYLPMLQPTPGAHELLQALHARGFRLVVATSAKKEEVDSLLAVCDGVPFFQAKTTSDDADKSKPDPDIVHAALKEIALPKEQVVMLGDTPYDIEAARKAGLNTIALRSGGWDDAALREAIAIYNDPADLLTHLDQSPLTQ